MPTLIYWRFTRNIFRWMLISRPHPVICKLKDKPICREIITKTTFKPERRKPGRSSPTRPHNPEWVPSNRNYLLARLPILSTVISAISSALSHYLWTCFYGALLSTYIANILYDLLYLNGFISSSDCRPLMEKPPTISTDSRRITVSGIRRKNTH